MRKRIIMIGGPYDTAENPMSVGVSVRDYIGESEPPETLTYPDPLREKPHTYSYDKTLNPPNDGKFHKDNDVYIYVYEGLTIYEIIRRLAKNYGKYEKFVTDMEHRVRREIENNEIDA